MAPRRRGLRAGVIVIKLWFSLKLDRGSMNTREKNEVWKSTIDWPGSQPPGQIQENCTKACDTANVTSQRNSLERDNKESAAPSCRPPLSLSRLYSRPAISHISLALPSKQKRSGSKIQKCTMLVPCSFNFSSKTGKHKNAEIK